MNIIIEPLIENELDMTFDDVVERAVLRHYLETRFLPFKQLIEEEEAKNDCFFVFHVKNKQIRFIGYGEDLKIKMNDSISNIKNDMIAMSENAEQNWDIIMKKSKNL